MPQPTHGTVAVIGLGYIGLPTAAILAHNGVKVIGVDVSDKSREMIHLIDDVTPRSQLTLRITVP